MSDLLKSLLLLVLSRGVGEEGEESETETETESQETETETEETETEESETETEEEEAPSGKSESRYQKDMRAARERAQAAENDAKKAREELAAARQQANPNAQVTESQKLWQEEEALLKDPNADSWTRYNIQSARNARAAEFNSQQALAEARDLKDQAEFDRIAAKNPKAVERYKDRVEELKKQFPGAARKKILATLLGEDMLDGKLKAPTSPAKKGDSASRGKLPGARSDVRSSGGGGGDSIEEIEKRLAGVNISRI